MEPLLIKNDKFTVPTSSYKPVFLALFFLVLARFFSQSFVSRTFCAI